MSTSPHLQKKLRDLASFLSRRQLQYTRPPSFDTNHAVPYLDEQREYFTVLNAVRDLLVKKFNSSIIFRHPGHIPYIWSKVPVALTQAAVLYSTCIADTRPLKQRIKPTSRRIQTFNRDLLTVSDFVDLSHLDQPSIKLYTGSARFTYLSSRLSKKPFPPNTRGFLYWHHDPSLPPTAGGIRFRLGDEADPNLFSTGTDLLYPNAMPWTIHLLSLACGSDYGSMKAQLIAERLVDAASFESLEKGTAHHNWNSTYIHKLDQPFELDITRALTIRIISPPRFGVAKLQGHFSDLRVSVRSIPYNGRILVRFEPSPFPEHARPAPRPPVIVLRVLKILTPIKVILPQYDMHVPVPVEGALLGKKPKGGFRNRVFSIDLERAPKYHRDLNILVDVIMLIHIHLTPFSNKNALRDLASFLFAPPTPVPSSPVSAPFDTNHIVLYLDVQRDYRLKRRAW
ncbi:hypothetical protein D9615_006724 [Tricholomella constricta]|uniref:Uncharacterized protein n=1 Tax=Tricholomella constricta TaxID=117010 RepID=A0A8H5H6Z4_9AGAR|nr:hypothetical protein D9615_006724 [Tricholomella constricta]